MSWQEEGEGRGGEERGGGERESEIHVRTCVTSKMCPTVAHLSKLVEGTIVFCNVVFLQVHNGITVVHTPEESRQTLRLKILRSTLPGNPHM